MHHRSRISIGSGKRSLGSRLRRTLGDEVTRNVPAFGLPLSGRLKEYIYKFTGGTGKYQGASGGGTYMYENIADTLAGGTYKGQLVLP
jgi:hypothetical protein